MGQKPKSVDDRTVEAVERSKECADALVELVELRAWAERGAELIRNARAALESDDYDVTDYMLLSSYVFEPKGKDPKTGLAPAGTTCGVNPWALRTTLESLAEKLVELEALRELIPKKETLNAKQACDAYWDHRGGVIGFVGKIQESPWRDNPKANPHLTEVSPGVFVADPEAVLHRLREQCPAIKATQEELGVGLGVGDKDPMEAFKKVRRGRRAKQAKRGIRST